MTLTSAVPGAIDAFVAMLLADGALDQVDVIDGPLLDWDAMQPAGDQRGDGTRWLVVGSQPGDDPTSTEGEQTWGATGSGTAHSRDETFAIFCTAVAYSGGSDAKAVRDDAFTMITRVELLLRNDPTISGSVLYSMFGGVTSMRQIATTKGITIDLLFNVQCRAYLTA
jgi:hypothetical protein